MFEDVANYHPFYSCTICSRSQDRSRDIMHVVAHRFPARGQNWLVNNVDAQAALEISKGNCPRREKSREGPSTGHFV